MDDTRPFASLLKDGESLSALSVNDTRLLLAAGIGDDTRLLLDAGIGDDTRLLVGDGDRLLFSIFE